MTPADLMTARRALGLNAAALGRALEMEGRDPGRYVRAWEEGAHPIPGPVAVAIRLMLEARARGGLQEAMDAAAGILTPAAPPTPVQAPPEAPRVALKTRRRG